MNTLLKQSSIFADLLMEKPDNSFSIVKMKKTPEEKTFEEKDLQDLKNSVWDINYYN